MDNNEKNISMKNGGLFSDIPVENGQRPYEEKIEIPLDDSETEYDEFMFEPLGFEELEKQKKVFVIAPETTMNVGRTESDSAKLTALYKHGYDVAMKLMPYLKKYLGMQDG